MTRHRLRKACVGAAAFVITVLVGAGAAGATWSIVGVDPATGEVGVAVASCVDIAAFADVDEPLPLVALSPGSGAGVSQALLNFEAPPEMARLLDEGASPGDVIAAVTNPAFDPEPQQRQHGVVTLDGATAAFTGSENFDTALDDQAPNVSAQGNLLVGDAVIDEAIAAFAADTTLPLAERLVSALYAGSLEGGDARCGEQTALFASVVVATPTDDADEPTTLETITSPEGSTNPVVELAAAFGLVDQPSDDGGGAWFLVVIIGAAVVVAVLAFTLLRRRGPSLPQA